MKAITELPFFQALNGGDIVHLDNYYSEFTDKVLDLCNKESHSLLERFFILNYTYTELISLSESYKLCETEKK